MERLFTDLIRIQVALVEGWIHLASHGWRTWQHLFGLNDELLRHPVLHRLHDVVPSNADWLDHYGKRAHDVDVEHLR